VTTNSLSIRNKSKAPPERGLYWRGIYYCLRREKPVQQCRLNLHRRTRPNTSGLFLQQFLYGTKDASTQIPCAGRNDDAQGAFLTITEEVT
jgi:hypothetical protein